MARQSGFLLAAGAAIDFPAWSALPFGLLLLSIALLPLAANRFWHQDKNKALVVGLLSACTALALFYVQLSRGQPALALLGHELLKYLSFIALLGSLYIVSGGIVIEGNLPPYPQVNTTILLLGALLANVVGTTGACMLLIRLLLRINQTRRHTAHLPLFFIFIVGNAGGLLTPLGDPPLFLGFLNGVPFIWTLRLWPHWLLVNGWLLTLFFFWDYRAYQGEQHFSVSHAVAVRSSIRVRGLINVPLLAGIMAGVLLQRLMPGDLGEALSVLLMAAMAASSLALTPKELRRANGHSWGPIIEVAILFFGIFVTMTPALALLAAHGKELRLTEPWQFFWLTGLLSSFLDNAPTYLTFGSIAAGSADFSLLVQDQAPGLAGPLILQAISCGAVFMGALTYVGNGPNFMVKAIAAQAGCKMPSFFVYSVYASLIFLPVMLALTALFFVGH
jgi:Na+/H+ antiporter NhaD/arsenite permease-like protein